MNAAASNSGAADDLPAGHGDRPVLLAAIVVAAGRGSRFGSDDNKVLLPLGDAPVWRHSVDTLGSLPGLHPLVVVVREEQRPRFLQAAGGNELVFVIGGRERIDSVRAGMEVIERLDAAAGIAAQDRLVVIHDAARPLVTAEDCRRVIEAARSSGAAILATPIRGTVKRLVQGRPLSTIDRAPLWEALTPQVFRLDLLLAAHRRWRGRPVTDDAELVERSGRDVTLVPGPAENLKITQAEDLPLALAILARRQASTTADP